ncbi:MAG: AbrB/MazE/SpoVT family DNA-binding domain-containing protein [Alphaproteobacteria bacterium]|nr:AbrB/MazE/SpoVT family DNA-binding domain-containing protein [Alphaproteobacteria bacterium]
MGMSIAPVKRTEMAKVVEGLETKSDKIRALNNAGCKRAQIAEFLDIRYQHVRNVLVQDAMKDAKPPADKFAMDRITEGMKTKADKIRALAQEGYSRSDSARYLRIRYQQVRNVLIRSDVSAGGNEIADRNTNDRRWSKIGPGGRVVISPSLLNVMGLSEGSDVQVVADENEIRIIPRDVVIARIQDLVAQFVPEGVSLVDELIAERRREAAREEQGD